MNFYKRIYPKSWQTIRNNYPYLFFGLFASILGFYELRVLFDLGDAGPDFIGSTMIFWTRLFQALGGVEIGMSNMMTFLGLIGFFVLLAIMTILAIASQGALVASANTDTTKGKNFKKLIQIGVDKFWPLLGLNIINTFIGYFFVSSVLNPMINFTATNTNWLIYFLLGIIIFMVLVPLIIILSFVTRYGTAFVVFKNQKLLLAFTNSWYLFKQNWLITLESAIMLSIITVVYFLLLFSALVFIFTPFLILSNFITFSTGAFLFVIIIGGLVALLAFIIGTSFFGAYYNLIWANIWLELTTKGKSHSKIYRVVNKHFPHMTR